MFLWTFHWFPSLSYGDWCLKIIGVHVSSSRNFCTNIFPRVGLLCPRVFLFLVSWVTSIAFSVAVLSIYIPTKTGRRYSFSHNHCRLICRHTNYDHLDRYEVVPQNNFDWQFLTNEWRSAFFHVIVGHRYIFLGKISFQVFCPIFMGLMVFFFFSCVFVIIYGAGGFFCLFVCFCFCFCFCLFAFWGPLPQHMEVPRLGV